MTTKNPEALSREELYAEIKARYMEGGAHKHPSAMYRADVGFLLAMVSTPTDRQHEAERLLSEIKRTVDIADGWEDEETFYKSAVKDIRELFAEHAPDTQWPEIVPAGDSFDDRLTEAERLLGVALEALKQWEAVDSAWVSETASAKRGAKRKGSKAIAAIKSFMENKDG